MATLKIVYKETAKLTASKFNARTHDAEQVQQIVESIKQFGFTNPLLIDGKDVIIAGHGRLEAAALLKMKKVPCVVLTHLSEREKRAYILADNKIALNSGWDFIKLAEEMNALVDLDVNLSVTGFDEHEIDTLLKEPEFIPNNHKNEKAKVTEGAAATIAKSKMLHTCPQCSHQFHS